MRSATILTGLLLGALTLSGCDEPYQEATVKEPVNQAEPTPPANNRSANLNTGRSSLGKAKGAAKKTIGDVEQRQRDMLKDLDKPFGGG